jgi:hypothetical protein
MDISQRDKRAHAFEARLPMSDQVYIRAAWPRCTAKHLAGALIRLGESCAVVTAKKYLAQGLPDYRRQKVLTAVAAEIARQREEQVRIWTALQHQLQEIAGRGDDKTADRAVGAPVDRRAALPRGRGARHRAGARAL